ncbi:IQ domain-containing protein iqm3 [Castilleja foliolosa]|uniref:IQ domain-containing protein iqm3 n=1 Tax=Castilleja foliolosa TaxID=1961234 RepID=A0ABD3CBX5_9LAMI
MKVQSFILFHDSSTDKSVRYGINSHLYYKGPVLNLQKSRSICEKPARINLPAIYEGRSEKRQLLSSWCKASADQPFFYWLDIGDGKEVDIKECSRSNFRQQCIEYLGPKERQHYEYHVVDGKILHTLTGEPLDTINGSPESKWIFVMSTSKRLYSGDVVESSERLCRIRKKKGLFHHSSFLAGGATLAAGRLIVDDGVLKCISAYSGHYRPTDDCLDTFLSFLNENGVNLDEVEDNFKAGDICFEAKETCNNWFNKIGSVRELLPRM